jgi:hypothetical protein
MRSVGARDPVRQASYDLISGPQLQASIGSAARKSTWVFK